MRNKTLLKTGAAYLLSLGVLLTSSVPTVAQEGSVQEQAEIQTQQTEELQTQAEEILTQPEETVMQGTETQAEETPAQESQTLETSAPEDSFSEPEVSQKAQETSQTEMTTQTSQAQDSVTETETQSESETERESEATTQETSGTQMGEVSEIESEEETETETQSESETERESEATTQETSEMQTEEVSEIESEEETEAESEEKEEESETEEESEEESESETEEDEFEGTEETFYATAVLNEEAQVYAGWKKDSAVLATLSAGFRVYVTSVVTSEDEPKWAHIIFEENEYSSEGYIPFEKLTISFDSDVMLADQTQNFPVDYQSALNALHKAHPNWVFRPIYVGDTFSYAVSQQMNTPARALINMYYNECFRSLLDRDYNWQTNTWKQWEPNWAGASEETVRYYMDPRNFLNETDIFMFESLTYESYQSEAAVEAALANEFMANAKVPGANYTYAWLFCWIGKKYNINPVALASRVRQEQGSGKSAMISGTYPGYEGLYNYFNIQATGSTTDEILRNGLTEARTGSTIMLPDGTVSTGSWNTPTKALIGGALKFANRYILQNQNTLYAQKFDYDGQFNGKYWHQYMTNILAPYSEGNQVRRSYSRTGQLNNSFVFLIPVYEARPTSSSKPTERKNLNNCINSLTVNDQQVIKKFDRNQKDFYYYVGSATAYANVKVTAAASTSKVSFQNIGTMSHKVEVSTITVTAENGSVATYRLIIGRGVQIAEGFFDGFDVNAYRKRYPQLSAQYGNDLDAYYEHYFLTGKKAGLDGSTNGPFPDYDNTSAVYDGVNYAAVFNAQYYLNRYADLNAAYGTNAEAALRHFVKYGMKEGRQASEEFNLSAYRSKYADLRKAFGSDNVRYYLHYINYGKAEGRNAKTKEISAVYKDVDYSAVYNYEYYRSKYADLAKAFGNNKDKYLQHFVERGMAEGRQASEEFNLSVYRSNYEDLKKAYGSNNVRYYLHYIKYGKAEGRNAKTNGVSTVYKGVDYSTVYNYEYYRSKYADLVKAFGNNKDKYLQHFVERGMAEGRQASAEFNVTAYKNRYVDLRNAFGNNIVLYYMHYINAGKSEGRIAAN